MPKANKTNAMRRLDTQKIAYELVTYDVDDDHFDGTLAAEKTGLDPAMVYKTLVLTADDQSHLVCVIPVGLELDLKAVARASGHKSAAMLHQKDLLPLTGYVRGGCTAVGMPLAGPHRRQRRPARDAGRPFPARSHRRDRREDSRALPRLNPAPDCVIIRMQRGDVHGICAWRRGDSDSLAGA